MHPQFASSHSTRISRAALLLAAAMAALPAIQAAPFTITGSVQAVNAVSESEWFFDVPPETGNTWDLGIGNVALGSIFSDSGGPTPTFIIAEGGRLFASGMGVGFKTRGTVPMSGYYEMGADGVVTVTGAGSLFRNSGDLSVADSAKGTFTISDGARVENVHAKIGFTDAYGEGSMTVTGAGSTWISSGNLSVGESGATGTIQIDNGASVWVGATTSLSATSSLTLDNGRLRLNGYTRNTATTLGFQSGLVQLAGDRVIGTDAAVTDFFGTTQGLWGPTTTIETGKHLAIEGNAAVAEDGALVVEAGASVTVGVPESEFAEPTQGIVVNSTLTLNNAEVVTEDGLAINTTGTVDGQGAVTGNVVNAGHISPHSIYGPTEPSWIDVYGDFTQTSTGSISLRIFDEGYSDSMFVEGTAVLAGTLNVLSPEGYMPGEGETFYLFTFESVTGAFADINLFTLTDGLAWDLSQLYVDGSISTREFVAPPIITTSIFINGAVTPMPGTAPVAEWNVGSALGVGFGGTGSLTIEAGGQVNAPLGFIGNGAGDVGTITVAGEDAVLEISGDLAVGESGTGTLAISEGGLVSNEDAYIGSLSGSVGAVTVDGEGSLWESSGFVLVGNEGHGSLSITNGGSVNAARMMIAGQEASRSSVTVTGANSSLTILGDLEVGGNGEGTLLIADGAKVSNADGYVGAYTTGRGQVRLVGAGSVWESTGALVVGRQGEGSLSIEAGGEVTSTYGVIGYDAGSRGEVTVSGAGSSWTVDNSRYDGSLYVGRGGEGVLSIKDGASVVSVGGSVGVLADSVGSVDVRGANSSWTSTGDLTVGDYGKGSVGVADGGLVDVSTASIFVGRNADSEGTIGVSGASSRLHVGDLVIGGGSHDVPSYASAKVSVSDGGRIDVTNTLTVHDTGVLTATLSGGETAISVGGDLVNNGTVKIVALNSLPAGSYNPIAVGGSASGYGTFSGVGGVWDEGTKQLVVSAPQVGSADTKTTVDLTQTQRVLVEEGNSSVAISYGNNAGSAEVTVGFSESGSGSGGSGGSAGGVSITSSESFADTFVQATIDLGGLVGGGAGEKLLALRATVSYLETTGDPSDFGEGGYLSSRADTSGLIIINNTVDPDFGMPGTFNPGSSLAHTPVLVGPVSVDLVGYDEGRKVAFMVTGLETGSGSMTARGDGSEFGGVTYYTIKVEFMYAPIPEPSSFAALAGFGVLGAALLRRRRH